MLLTVVCVMSLNLVACTEQSVPPVPKEVPSPTSQETTVNEDSSAQLEQSEQRVRDRAAAYLEALRLNHLAGAYRMEAGYLDGSLTPLVFQESAIPFSGTLLKYTITAVTLQGEEATVEADVSYKLPQLRKPYANKMSMHWVTRNGEYYHQFQQPSEANFSGVASEKAPQGISQGPNGGTPLKIQ
jgi:hypothetical protein